VIDGSVDHQGAPPIFDVRSLITNSN